VLEHYTPAMLSAFISTCMAAVMISYALYIHEQSGAAQVPWLALTVPFVLFGVFRYYHLVEVAGLGEKPEDVLLGDRPIQICVAGFALVALGALYLGG
jgi:hypothetical protein